MSFSSFDQRPLRVFVVENHADTLKYFKMYLEELGHTVMDAGTMAEALSKVPEAGCDVLISDIGLSDGTGWDLLRRLRQEGLPHPAYSIAMSGLGMNADRAKSEAAGFRRHLLEPFDPKEVDGMLEEAAREAEAGQNAP